MLISDGVYIYEVQELEDGGEAKGIVGSHTKLTLTMANENIIATYNDWRGNPLPQENRPITISITGETNQELIMVPINGQITFEAPPAGCIIRAKADFPCDVAELRT